MSRYYLFRALNPRPPAHNYVQTCVGVADDFTNQTNNSRTENEHTCFGLSEFDTGEGLDADSEGTDDGNVDDSNAGDEDSDTVDEGSDASDGALDVVDDASDEGSVGDDVSSPALRSSP